jgi:type II secretory ATPase GspE/PulE/Tfp pilus assembly ATPase PilB-like protein
MTLPSAAPSPARDKRAAQHVTIGFLQGKLAEGRLAEGRLAEFSPDLTELSLETLDGGRETIPVRQVAYIGFHRDPFDLLDEDLPGALDYKVHLHGGGVFPVLVVPGSWQSASGFFGLPRGAGTFRELFFFNHSVLAKERDEPIGTMLIKQGAIHPDALSHALSAQNTGRATPIGQILVEKLKVSEEDVARAIALQQERKQRIGEVLTEEGLATAEDVEAALLEQKKRKGKRLGEVLIDLNIVTEQTLQKTLAKKFDLRFVNCSEYPAAPELMSEVSAEIAEKYGILPIELRDDKLVLAIADPLALDGVHLAARGATHAIELVMTTPAALRAGLDAMLGHVNAPPPSTHGAELDSLLKSLAEEHPFDDLPRVGRVTPTLAPELPVPDAFEQLVQDAARRNASHIHLESDGAGHALLRFRSEGVCEVIDTLPAGRIEAMLRHAEELAQLSALERDVPQQGTLSLQTASGPYELSVSSVPLAPSGTDLVLAFVQDSRQLLTLDELGFAPGALRALQRSLEQPSGLILFTGPMGSGRTTSMHAALASLDADRLKLWVADDDLAPFGAHGSDTRIRQLQVKPHLGLGFASALRCLLRADADVVLLGELDDAETARIALDAVHAGRRILSAINARSAIEGLARLLDVALDARAVGDSLRAVVSQRLVRRLCPECREAAPATLAERDGLSRACRNVQVESLLRWVFEPDLVFWRKRGCKACGSSGYAGQIALFELLVVDPELARAVASRTSVRELHELAVRNGATSLLQDGIAKALAGMTDLEQVLGALGSHLGT